MRTTIDIPEPLLRRLKATAALRGMKLKDLFTLLVESGLPTNEMGAAKLGHSRPIPVRVEIDSAVPSLSYLEIEQILIDLDMKSLERG